MYAIKQKSTGYYLPMARKGNTWVELKQGNLPRLFARKGDAVLALNYWLKGKGEHLYSPAEDRYYIEYNLDLARVAEDMEIVEIILIEVRRNGTNTATEMKVQDV